MFRIFSKLIKGQSTGNVGNDLRKLHLVEVEQRILLSASPIDSDDLDNQGPSNLDQDISSSNSDLYDYDQKLNELTAQLSIMENGEDASSSAPLIVNEDLNNTALPESTLATESATSREIIFIDGSLDEIDSLLTELLDSKPNGLYDIQIINSAADGIQQISSTLQSKNIKYDGIHILSHGNEGSILLGDSILSSSNLDQYSDQLSSWSDFLTEDADLLFYGCQLAGNASGLQLINSIAGLTKADVAASVNLTGSTAAGGDWVLEHQVGSIETVTFVAEGYHYTLDTINGTAGVDVLEGTAGADTITGGGGNDIILGGPNLLGVGNLNSSSTVSELGVTGTNSGWTVVSNNVDFLGTDSPLSRPNDPNDAGLRAVDLNDGGIETSLSGLTIGQTYSVVFFMGADGVTTQSLDVILSGLPAQSVSVTTPPGNTLATMDWQPQVISFTASSTSHNLRFQSTTGTPSDGPIISAIRVIHNNVTSGNDTIHGNDGDDVIITGSGANTVYGGAGNDTVIAGSGNDYIYGEAGNDLVWAGDGYDRIDGGLDSDTLYGEGGYDDFNFTGVEDGAQDILDGGAGDDWYYIYDNNTPDIIQDSGTDGLTDVLWLDTAANSTYFLTDNFSKAITGIDEISFTYSNSYTSIIGSSSHSTALNWDFTGIDLQYVDQIHGGTQDDTITLGVNSLSEIISVYGNGGEDLIYDNGTGGNTLIGSDEDDTIFGGAGNDSIYGHAGNDTSVYDDLFENYTIDRTNYLGNNDSGYITVAETTVNGTNEGTDLVYGTVESLIFADGTYDVATGIFYSTAPSDIELANPNGTNIITNGSFETNSGVSGDANIGIGSIPGWTPIGGGGFELWVNHDYFGPGTASDGQANLELNVDGSINGISQDVSTASGQKYVLSFDLSNRGFSTAAEVEIYWQGSLIGTIIQTTVGWKTHSFVVIGSGGLDELKFLETSGNNSTGSGLFDNVRLVASGSPTISVKEHSRNGTVVAFTGTTDPTVSPVDTRSFTLSDNAGGRFAIDSETGVITVANGSLLDYESATSHNITVRVTDSTGGYREETFSIALTNTDDIPTVSITEDTNSDGLINALELSGGIDVQVTLPSEANAGDTVTVTDGSSPQAIVLTSTDISNGYINATFVSPGDGNSISISAQITDSYGILWSSSVAVNALIDTTPPSAPSVTIQEDANDDGFINIAESIGAVDVRVTLPGNAVAGDVLTVTDGSSPQNILLTSTHITNGYLDTSFASPGDGNSINVNAYVTDVAGNVGASAADVAIVDTTVPNATISLDPNIATDGIVNSAESAGNITISGSVGGDVQNGDTVTLTLNGNNYIGNVSGGSFNILVSGSDLVSDADSIIDASVTTFDLAGNQNSAQDTEGFLVDTTPPSAPMVTILEDTNDDGFINIAETIDNVDVRITLPGDAVSGDMLTISDGASPQNIILNPSHITNGFLETSFVSPGDGNTSYIFAFVTDIAGNTGPSSADSALVDLTPPNAMISLDPNVTPDDIVNAAETPGMIPITGSVGGEVQDGDMVALMIHGVTFYGTVSGGTFSISVPGRDLAMDSDFTIDASVTIADVAGNTTTAQNTDEYMVDLSDSEKKVEQETQENTGPKISIEELHDPKLLENTTDTPSKSSEEKPMSQNQIQDENSNKKEMIKRNDVKRNVGRTASETLSSLDILPADSPIIRFVQSLEAIGQVKKVNENIDIVDQVLFENLFSSKELYTNTTPEEQDVLIKERIVNYSIVASSTLATIGYLLWAVRGGVLMASILSSLPNWKLIDPLPVLDGFANGENQQHRTEAGIDELLNEMDIRE